MWSGLAEGKSSTLLFVLIPPDSLVLVDPPRWPLLPASPLAAVLGQVL